MLNAWRCIGPGTAGREEKACSSCLAVVLHEPGSSSGSLASVHSLSCCEARVVAGCMHRTRCGQLPGLDYGVAHASSRTSWEQRGHHAPPNDREASEAWLLPAQTPSRSAVHTILILAWQQGHPLLSAAVESFLPQRAVCCKPYVL